MKNKFQAVIPRKVREKLPVNVGDILDAKVERGKITLTPKPVIDCGIEQGLADIRAGRSFGPFGSGAELVQSLHTEARRLRRGARKRAR